MPTGSPIISLDTNILVYAADSTAGERHELAYEIVAHAARRRCVLALQSLGEFAFVVGRKGLLDVAETARRVALWRRVFPTVHYDGDTIARALGLVGPGRLAFWDAMLIATLDAADCEFILSEDMADRSRFGGIQVIHPFANGRLSESARTALGLS